MRLSWIPEGVHDPQNMVSHPFGITHRRGGGYPWHPAWETTWYWRRYYVHFCNVLHPQFWRTMWRSPHRWSSIRFFVWRAVRWGRD